jgi:4-carboxymuconolactone decarboxylase
MTTDGPRLEPVPRAEWDERLTRLLESAPGGTGEPMHIFTTLAHQPEVFRRWLGFGGALLNGRLPGRVRELVILRTSARVDGPYEWAHHIELGEAQAITLAEMTELGGDLSATAWTPLERAALDAVDETVDNGAIADGTWSVLVRDLDAGELVELVMLIGHYLMLATVLRSLRVPIEAQAQAQAARVPGGPPA